MGNKRKAIAIILGVFFFAFVTISSAFMSVKFNDDDNTKTNAATVEIGKTLTLTNTGVNGEVTTGTVDLTFGRKYLVLIYGQDGQNGKDGASSGGKAGKGAEMFGFISADSNTTNIKYSFGRGAGQFGNKAGGGMGGGFTAVDPVNFALPAGQAVSWACVGGGGGGGAGDLYNVNVTAGNGGNSGVVGSDGTSHLAGHAGKGATQTAVGSGGNWDGKSGEGSAGGTGGYYGGGGGGGWWGGGGGGYYNVGYDYVVSGGGGGGSSSPNLYEKVQKAGDDSRMKNGGIRFYDISPTRNPVGNKTMIGTTATITAGAAADIKDGTSKSLGRFEYSENAGSTWTTTAPTLSTVGKKTVYWRYVIGFDTFWGNKPTLSVVAGGVNTEGTLTLEVVGGPGSCTAPTITPDLTYIGETAQQVVKTLGTASGTFTFAVSKDSLTTNLDASSSQYSSLKWCTSLTDANNKLILKANEQYYVYYYSKQTTNGYLATTVQKVTLAKIMLSV